MRRLHQRAGLIASADAAGGDHLFRRGLAARRAIGRPRDRDQRDGGSDIAEEVRFARDSSLAKEIRTLRPTLNASDPRGATWVLRTAPGFGVASS